MEPCINIRCCGAPKTWNYEATDFIACPFYVQKSNKHLCEFCANIADFCTLRMAPAQQWPTQIQHKQTRIKKEGKLLNVAWKWWLFAICWLVASHALCVLAEHCLGESSSGVLFIVPVDLFCLLSMWSKYQCHFSCAAYTIWTRPGNGSIWSEFVRIGSQNRLFGANCSFCFSTTQSDFEPLDSLPGPVSIAILTAKH